MLLDIEGASVVPALEKALFVDGRPVHRMLLKEGKVSPGYLDFVFRNTPVPYVYLDNMVVHEEYRGEGYGSKLLEVFNALVRNSNRPGLLRNIIPDSDFAYGIYEKHGWVQIEEFPGWYTFNLLTPWDRQTVVKTIHQTRGWIARSFKNYPLKV